MDNKKIISNVLYFIVAFAIVVVLFKFTSIFEPAKPDTNTNANTNTSIPINISSGDLQNINTGVEQSDLDKFFELKKNGKVLNIFTQKIISPQFTPNDQSKNNEVALEFLKKNSKKISSQGNINRGYLYLKAGAGSVSDISTISSNESVFIYLGATGGHLFFPDSLVNLPTDDGYTQFLFELKDIEFTNIPYSEENESYTDNWLKRLNDPGDYFIGAFVSANRFAVIEEITIVYEGEGNLIVE